MSSSYTMFQHGSSRIFRLVSVLRGQEKRRGHLRGQAATRAHKPRLRLNEGIIYPNSTTGSAVITTSLLQTYVCDGSGLLVLICSLIGAPVCGVLFAHVFR